MIPLRVDRLAVVGDEHRLVVLQLAARDPQPLVLTGAAPVIWAGIDGMRTVDEVVVYVAEVTAMPVDTIAVDVHSCIDSLVALGLIVLR